MNLLEATSLHPGVSWVIFVISLLLGVYGVYRLVRHKTYIDAASWSDATTYYIQDLINKIENMSLQSSPDEIVSYLNEQADYLREHLQPSRKQKELPGRVLRPPEVQWLGIKVLRWLAIEEVRWLRFESRKVLYLIVELADEVKNSTNSGVGGIEQHVNEYVSQFKDKAVHFELRSKLFRDFANHEIAVATASFAFGALIVGLLAAWIQLS